MQTVSAFRSPPRLLTAPQPIDRLGIVTLLSSLYFLQVWGLVEPTSGLPPVFHYTMIGVSFAGILIPRRWQVLGINAAAFTAYYLLHSPVASNNQTTAFFFALIVGAVYLTTVFRRPHDRNMRESVFSAIAGPARWILAGLYFYGIYHKINADFLDPAVSCAVVLYRTLAGHVYLEDFAFGHYGAIYATFIVEAVAMVALFIPRLKRFGMMVGLPFHIVIGFTGYAYYKDFSTIVLVLYALFLPKQAVDYGIGKIMQWAGGEKPMVWIGRMALIAFVASYLLTSGMLWDLSKAAPTHSGFVWYFAAYSFVFYAFVMLSMHKPRDRRNEYKLNWLYIVPALFFLNGMSPYLGLKTESSMAMFSNLHTEGGQTNHLLHGRLANTFTYQEDPLTLLRLTGPQFSADYRPAGKTIVRYELDRLLSRNPGLIATLKADSGPFETGADWENTYDATNRLMQKLLIFKPVDFARPKTCTH